MALHWRENLVNHMQFRSVIILHGNVNDRFPNAAEKFETLPEVVETVAKEGGWGFRRVDVLAGKAKPDPRSGPSFDIASLKVAAETQATCWYMENTQSIFHRVSDWHENDWRAHEELLSQIESCDPDGNLRGRHRFVLIFPDEGRIPGNFLANVPRATRLAIPFPDYHDRMSMAGARLRSGPATPKITDEVLRRFVALTEGLYWDDLNVLIDAAAREITSGVVPDLPALVRRFKFGEDRDYWGELWKDSDQRGRLAKAKAEFTAGADPILGQDEAVTKALDVVAKACLGLSSIVAPADSRPKGVLFFVGPTGVGKTMLAKKLAKLIFGDESSCIVFDMSEYRAEHSDARLIGSPPGYVGYDEGGQLTSRVRQRPFSVLLFDEIDKANQTVLEKFLQILDEGRLTDGKGQVCHFSETLIVFTSNAGAVDLGHRVVDGVTPESPYQDLQAYYQRAVADRLAERPEIVNRIGLSNIIAFKHILDPTCVARVLEGMIDRTLVHFVKNSFGMVDFGDDAHRREIVNKLVEQSDFRSMGMRNVKQVFEANILEKVARLQLANPAAEPIRIRVDGEQIVSALA